MGSGGAKTSTKEKVQNNINIICKFKPNNIQQILEDHYQERTSPDPDPYLLVYGMLERVLASVFNMSRMPKREHQDGILLLTT